MKLFHREFKNNGPHLIIMHGLYGASDNWISIARMMEEHFHIFLIDLRNHGRSPHSNTHDYKSMAEDLLLFFDDNNIDKAIVAGHSMGGKTAMYFTLNNPQRVSKLVVIDIAPKPYNRPDNSLQISNDHATIINSMLETDLSEVSSRKEIDREWALHLADRSLRHFRRKKS